jgi:hypothetical protein
LLGLGSGYGRAGEAMSTADQAKALAELSAEIDAFGGRKRR